MGGCYSIGSAPGSARGARHEAGTPEKPVRDLDRGDTGTKQVTFKQLYGSEDVRMRQHVKPAGPRLRRFVRPLVTAGIVAVALSASAAANALTFVTGGEYRVGFDGHVGGLSTAAVSGLSSSLVLKLVSVTNGWFTFDYSLTNSSSLDSRITSFGFASIPDVTDGRVVSGAFTNMLVENDTWLPVNYPDYKAIEMCLTTGLVCSGGAWGGAGDGSTLSGRFQVKANGPTLDLDNFAVRYQSINGASNGRTFRDASGVGLGVVSPVPEPSVWAMLIIGFGLVGRAIRQQRRRLSWAAPVPA